MGDILNALYFFDKPATICVCNIDCGKHYQFIFRTWKGGLYVMVERFLLIFGIPLAVIFGGGALINTDNPEYYMYVGILGSVFIIVSFIMKYYKKNQEQRNAIK